MIVVSSISQESIRAPSLSRVASVRPSIRCGTAMSYQRRVIERAAAAIRSDDRRIEYFPREYSSAVFVEGRECASINTLRHRDVVPTPGNRASGRGDQIG